MTLEQIASAVRTHVGHGLKEVTNYNYSIEQIKKDVGLMRSSLIKKDSEKGKLQPEHFVQKFENIDLTLTTFPYTATTDNPAKVWYAQIPRLEMTVGNQSLPYIGPTDFSKNFKQYYDHSYQAHKYRRVTSRSPFTYVDLAHDYENHTDVYFFNIDGSGLRKISARAIVADPIAVLEADGIFGAEEEFPAPQAIQDQIIDALTRKYITYYRQLRQGSQPNTQTDIN
jgi:hypothetical protein